MELMLPLGNDDFSEIRRNKDCYIDKTQFIEKLMNMRFKVALITRPRRFGKTLMMSMLDDFFDIQKDSKEDFAGLQIMQNETICSEWMNQYPTIFLTLKNVEGNNFNSAYGMMKALIADICKKYVFLEKSSCADSDDTACFSRLKSEKATDADVKNSLYTISRMMYAHYGKPIILLVDEYDVPLANASEKGYYHEMMDVIRAMLGKVLKTNEFLKFAVLTGCLKIAKESIFTGLNNLVSDTITGDRFDKYFGFTENDVKQLLMDADLSSHAEEMKTWYDGYHFGRAEVYCPWDVLNHVAALQVNPRKRPQNYWASTSHNGVIRRFISREDMDVNEKFETLLAGGTITEQITEDLTYDTIESSEETLWSLLFMTGYLTKVDIPEEYEPFDDSEMTLRIPNEEVKSIFKTAIVNWFRESIQTTDRKPLFDALWNGEAVTAERLISEILFDTISYHDYLESYYHAFLAGLFAGAGYVVASNAEHGKGRPDVVIKDRKNRRILVIEVKHAKSEKELSKKCDEAIAQIQEQQYAVSFQRGYYSVISYGIAFWEKECKIAKV